MTLSLEGCRNYPSTAGLTRQFWFRMYRVIYRISPGIGTDYRLIEELNIACFV